MGATTNHCFVVYADDEEAAVGEVLNCMTQIPYEFGECRWDWYDYMGAPYKDYEVVEKDGAPAVFPYNSPEGQRILNECLAEAKSRLASQTEAIRDVLANAGKEATDDSNFLRRLAAACDNIHTSIIKAPPVTYTDESNVDNYCCRAELDDWWNSREPEKLWVVLTTRNDARKWAQQTPGARPIFRGRARPFLQRR